MFFTSTLCFSLININAFTTVINVFVLFFSDASKFISVLLTSLSTMLQIELPHVNILSKADLIEKYGKLAFNLDFYTEVLDLSYILDQFKVI